MVGLVLRLRLITLWRGGVGVGMAVAVMVRVLTSFALVGPATAAALALRVPVRVGMLRVPVRVGMRVGVPMVVALWHGSVATTAAGFTLRVPVRVGMRVGVRRLRRRLLRVGGGGMPAPARLPGAPPRRLLREHAPRHCLRAHVHAHTVDGAAHALALDDGKVARRRRVDAERLSKLEERGGDWVGGERLHRGGEAHHPLHRAAARIVLHLVQAEAPLGQRARLVDTERAQTREEIHHLGPGRGRPHRGDLAWRVIPPWSAAARLSGFCGARSAATTRRCHAPGLVLASTGRPKAALLTCGGTT